MSKAEQLVKAIETSLAAVEPRRALCWRLCREHVARITPAHTVADLANHFAAAFFADEALNAEAQGVCRCYIAYTDIFKAETREKSTRLDPIRDAIRAAGYSNGYDPTSLSYDVGKREHVCASFTVGPWGQSGDWRNRVLNGGLPARRAEAPGERSQRKDASRNHKRRRSGGCCLADVEKAVKGI